MIPQYGISQSLYWIGFPDKSNNTFSIQNPEQYLSKKAIQRRANQHIAIEEEDLPVSQPYIDSIQKTGATILFTLKWLNGVVVKPSVSQLNSIKNLGLPLTIISIYEPTTRNSSSGIQKTKATTEAALNQSYYGNGLAAISNVSGNFLHQKGLLGQEMLIAIIDDGFYNANKIGVFTDAFASGRVVATKDFVNPQSDIFSEDSHGTHVFSIIGAKTPSVMVGTAPEAQFVLLRSENFDSEQLVEEYYWSAAAEYADSIGADLVNTSLGYTTFDIPSQNHVYSDLTGEATPISKSCSIAAKKGMLMVCSAGNEGNKTWKYISVPADAQGIIAVGATTLDSSVSTFSSIGPSADGRVKPEVAALGSEVGIISDKGAPIQGNGTSYSAPIITGMAACLWQAFPTLTSDQIREAIILTANQNSNPTNTKGFGIPNARQAYNYLLVTYGGIKCIKPEISPNPFSTNVSVTISAPTSSEVEITIYTSSGESIYREKIQVSANGKIEIPVSKDLPKGIYIMNIMCGECIWKDKLVKQ